MLPEPKKLKRKNPELPPREVESLKKAKKLNINPKMIFLFIM